MKPSRPKLNNNKKKPAETQESSPETVRIKSLKRKQGCSSGKSRSRSKENWQLLTRSSVRVLENIVDLSVLTCLSLNRREKEETQKHLNILKSRLVDVCAELRVPPGLKDLEVPPGRQQDESRRSLAGKKTLSLLESDLDSVLAALEEVQEEKSSVEQSCTSLRRQLGEEEEEAAEMLELAERCVLHLPAQPTHKYTSTQQGGE